MKISEFEPFFNVHLFMTMYYCFIIYHSSNKNTIRIHFHIFSILFDFYHIDEFMVSFLKFYKQTGKGKNDIHKRKKEINMIILNDKVKWDFT